MSEQGRLDHNQDPQSLLLDQMAERANLIAELTQGEGVLASLASLKLEYDPLLAKKFGTDWHPPHEVYDIVLARPEKGEPLSPRGELVKELNQATKQRVNERTEDIIAQAVATGQRRESETEDHSIIQIDKAIFLDEGGANKTSVIRRGVTERALHDLFGEDLSDQKVYQLGSDRIISPLYPDGNPNPEHKTIRALVGEYLPEGPFTEFEANVATALADGYKIESKVEDVNDRVARVTTLTHEDKKRPQLVEVQPTGVGLPGGFDALATLEPLSGHQFVIGTNGQYRPKDELQAATWARENGVNMVPAVAIGDEPGDKFVFKGEEIETPARPAAAYVNELAILGRLTAAEIVERASHDDYLLPGHVTYQREGNIYVVEPGGKEWCYIDNTASIQYAGPNDNVGMSSQ